MVDILIWAFCIVAVILVAVPIGYQAYIKPIEEEVAEIKKTLEQMAETMKASEHFFATITLPEETIYGDLPKDLIDRTISADIENLFKGDYNSDWSEMDGIIQRGSDALASKH
jgi:uncharacterized protein YoxC